MSKSQVPSHGSSMWEKQMGATGITYHDPNVSEHNVGSTDHREYSLGATEGAAPVYPAKFRPAFDGNFHFDLVQSDHRHLKIRPQVDHTLNSRAGMFSSLLGTAHPLPYIEKK